MPKPTKVAPVKQAAPTKARATKVAKSAVAARPGKAVAEKKSVECAQTRRKPTISPEQRHSYVEVAAYFIAERHGFKPGRESEDWAAAEAAIDRMIAEDLLRTA